MRYGSAVKRVHETAMTNHLLAVESDPDPGFEAAVMAGEADPSAIVIPENNVCSRAIESASTQAAMQPWVSMECYQLGRGKHLAQMDCLDLGNRRIVREQQQAAVQKLGVAPPNLCTVSCCSHDLRFRFSDVSADNADTLFFMPGNHEFDLYVPGGAQTAYVSFDQDEFLSGARALNPADWERAPAQVLSIRTTEQASFLQLVTLFFEMYKTFSTWGDSVDHAVVHDALLQNILQLAASPGVGESEPPPLDRIRAFHTCRAARVFVEESLAADKVPTIVDICHNIGVSERTLQYAFRVYVHLSPLAYLRMCRLNRVRETLHAADPDSTTVTAVAMRNGFLHLGRFSVDYRRTFGETPSATLGC